MAGTAFMAFKRGSKARFKSGLVLNKKPTPMAAKDESEKAVKTSENVILRGSTQSPEVSKAMSRSSTLSGWGKSKLETSLTCVITNQAEMMSARKIS